MSNPNAHPSNNLFQYLRVYGEGVLKMVKKYLKAAKNNTTVRQYLPIKYNHTCHMLNILPKSLRFSPQIQSGKGFLMKEVWLAAFKTSNNRITPKY